MPFTGERMNSKPDLTKKIVEVENIFGPDWTRSLRIDGLTAQQLFNAQGSGGFIAALDESGDVLECVHADFLSGRLDFPGFNSEELAAGESEYCNTEIHAACFAYACERLRQKGRLVWGMSYNGVFTYKDGEDLRPRSPLTAAFHSIDETGRAVFIRRTETTRKLYCVTEHLFRSDAWHDNTLSPKGEEKLSFIIESVNTGKLQLYSKIDDYLGEPDCPVRGVKLVRMMEPAAPIAANR